MRTLFQKPELTSQTEPRRSLQKPKVKPQVIGRVFLRLGRYSLLLVGLKGHQVGLDKREPHVVKLLVGLKKRS